MTSALPGSLAGLSLAALEALYARPLVATSLSGVHTGTFLGFLDTRGARALHTRIIDSLLFVTPRFGVDFTRNLWWFGDPRLALGRFRVSPGRSRWRDADVLRLEYDVSRLPWPIPRILYDELKPLGDGRALGIGGVKAGPGQGDHFFFELRP